MQIRLVLFQPEIPQNVGTLMRFAACMGVPLDIIEPCGFLFTDKHLKRAGMDYIEKGQIHRFSSWSSFCEAHKARRVAVTPQAKHAYQDFSFASSDLLIMGQESAGLPREIIQECEESIFIPMVAGARSLNLAVTASIVTTEALRQTQQLPFE